MACTEVIEPVVGGGDALLEGAHLGRQGRLVADGAGDAAEEGGDLGAGLGEAEDVVDEEQHVLRPRRRGSTRRGEAERATRARAPGGSFIWPNTRATLEMACAPASMTRTPIISMVEVVALAGALADAGEHREAAVLLDGDVVDQLQDEDGLADAGAAEEADLAAAAVGARRSMTLMPVSKVSTLVDWCSSNFGGARWMGRTSWWRAPGRPHRRARR
jgi:hypothetical protein